jgi:hypothetical protein
MGTINAIKLTITSHLFNQSIGILGNRIKKIPPTLIYNLNDRTVLNSMRINWGIGKKKQSKIYLFLSAGMAEATA